MGNTMRPPARDSDPYEIRNSRGHVFFWLTIVGISCWWNLVDERRESEKLALETARAFFRQLVITRAWNAEHEGVYVPISKDLVPNPYLDDPLRDLVTEQGNLPDQDQSRLHDPADCRNRFSGERRQVPYHQPQADQTAEQGDSLGRAVAALLRAGDGRARVSFVRGGGQSFFRYMAPLKVEESCLKCHAKQGYKQGRFGAASVSPSPIWPRKKTPSCSPATLSLPGSGMILILTGGTLLARKRAQLLQSNESLQQRLVEREQLINDLKEANSRINTLCGIVPICMYCKGIRDDKGYWNQLEKFISEHSMAQFSHGICPKCMKEHHPDVKPDEE